MKNAMAVGGEGGMSAADNFLNWKGKRRKIA